MPPKTLPGIPPLDKHAVAYEKALRKDIVLPMVQRMERDWAAVEHEYHACRARLAQARAYPESLAPSLQRRAQESAQAHAARVDKYHINRSNRIYRKHLGITLTGSYQQRLIPYVEQNVALIRTIPERYLERLAKSLNDLNVKDFSDQSKVKKLLRGRPYKSTGYDLRRLTRDQNNKLVGQLSMLRQREVGIERYEWSTSNDERVRPTHVQNDGQVFAWGSPPGNGTGPPGHDVQCRCVALPVVGAVQRPEPEPQTQATGLAPPPAEQLRYDPEAGHAPLRGRDLRSWMQRRTQDAVREHKAALRTQYRELNRARRVQRRELEALHRESDLQLSRMHTAPDAEKAMWGRQALATQERIYDLMEELATQRSYLRDLARQYADPRIGYQRSEELIREFKDHWLRLEDSVPVPHNKINISIKEGGISKAERTAREVRVSNAVQDFFDMTGENPVWQQQGIIDISTTKRVTRSYYDRDARTVMLNADPYPDIVIHELAHALEHFDNEYLKRSIRYLQKRTPDEQAVRLKDVSGNKNYDSWEVTRADKWERTYTGKIYGTDYVEPGILPNPWYSEQHGNLSAAAAKKLGIVDNSKHLYASEVLSMGLEQMYQDPYLMATQDSAFFDWVWDTVVGVVKGRRRLVDDQ